MSEKNAKPITYKDSGVASAGSTTGMKNLLDQVGKTLQIRPAALELGYFASVVDVGGGLGVAVTTDGVGSKILVAEACGKFDTVGIDCVAMNANDIVCVGARPLSMVDYIAVQEMREDLLTEIGKGLYEGARQARINIPGGEVAQLKEMVTGAKQGYGFDLVGTCIGTVALDKIMIGENLAPGDVVIGIASSGIHSNGLTLARRVLLDKMQLSLDKELAEFGRAVGEELLEPTTIYVSVAMELIDSGLNIKSLAHITGDGLMNLARTKKKVGFHLTDLPEAPPIFGVIAEGGPVSHEEMWNVFNMGIGFCVVVDPEDSAGALEMIGRHHDCQIIGHVIKDSQQRVFLEPKELVGTAETGFIKAKRADREHFLRPFS